MDEESKLPEDIKRYVVDEGVEIDDGTSVAIFCNTVILPELLKYKQKFGESPRYFNAHITLASEVLRMCDEHGRDFVMCGHPGDKVYVYREIKLFGMTIKADLETEGEWRFEK